jgi:hypothetical protein
MKNTLLVSPTQKRTEGRAPVWGSEFTSKDAALQEGGEIAARLNVQLCVCLTGGGDWWYLTPISPNPLSTRKLKADEERAVRGSSEIFEDAGLCFCNSRLAACCPARVARCPKRAATQTTPGRAAVGPRRDSVPQAPTVQTFRQCWSTRRNATAIDLNSPRGLTYHCTDKVRYI